MYSDLRSNGLIVHPLPIDRSKTNLAGELKTLIKMYLAIRRIKPDVVHLVTIKPVIYGGILARITGVKNVIAAISGLGFIFSEQGWKARFRRLLVSAAYKIALNHSHLKVIFQNPVDRKTLMRLANLSESQVITIPGSGVDLSIYRNSSEPTKNTPVIMLAARLLRDKGVIEFVQAARLIKKSGVEARFCLVGAPDPANPNTVTKDELGKWIDEGIVESWGQRSDMPSVLSSANLIVLPSYYGEGLPKILVEAAACGRAVITTDMPGCRDAVIPNCTGILVPPRDSEKLAKAIKQLLCNEDLRKQMGTSGRQLAEKLFSIELVVQTHLRLYQELLNKVP